MLPSLLGDGGGGIGVVTWYFDSHQDPRVQPSLGLDRWEPSQSLLGPSEHFPLEPGLPWGLSVKAHSLAPLFLNCSLTSWQRQ